MIVKIALWIVVPTVLVGAYYGGKYGYNYIKKKMDDKKLDALTKQMRDKYTEINSFEDFYAGVPYQQSGTFMGYELVKLKDIKDIDKKITLDELKAIYEISKLEAGKITDEQSATFLDLMHRIYP